MKFLSTTVLLLLFTGAPLLAQERDTQLTAWVSRASIDSDANAFSDGFASEFDDGWGAGFSVNCFVTRMISVEGAAFFLRNDARLLIDGVTPVELGTVNLRPISIGAQIHLPQRSRFDPYVGAGAAYVVAGDLISRDLEAGGVGTVELENKVTYYVNAGVGVQLVEALAVVADVRYLPFETDGTSAITGVNEKIDLTTQFISLGLRFRF